MSESLKSKTFRYIMNSFPAYFCTGAKVLYISGDWKRVRVKISLNFITRNYVKVIFGGSLYASIDPVYMLLFMKILGKKYIVWDKAASIKFKRPGNTTLYADFKIEDNEIDFIKDTLEKQETLERTYKVYYKDRDGKVFTQFDKLLYFKKK